MKIDVVRYIGAVTREVRESEQNGRPARVVVASRTYDTSIEDLWDAITNPERIPRWFLPVTGDLRAGGRYQLQGNAGGEITECAPPRRFSLTWVYAETTSWVAVTLKEVSKGTRLELEHTTYVDDHWNQFGPGATGVGWDLAITGLGHHLATGAAVDPKDAAEWPLSEEGKDFARRSSDDWCRAAIASGTDPAVAKASAARTTAFYTGEGEPPAHT
ncbi:SRPBCC family protein [Pendulispora albinea]|uniref:SRPBCC family protein n=1 Tax=Pendulispora albinea TaxID=2741071 RepID=A0ABZ2LS84_9BACT